MPAIKINSGKIFLLSNGISILESAAQNGIRFSYSCKTGRCSSCKCKVISGETTELIPEMGLSENEKINGWILSCARTAATDLVLEIDDIEGISFPDVKTQICKIKSLKKLAPDVMLVELRLPPNVVFEFIPGQYIQVIGPGGIRRSYSIANSAIIENSLELHIRAVESGAMSKYWFDQANVGDLLRINGPHGTFVLRNVHKRNLVFLSTGTGFAPVKAMLEQISQLPPDQVPNSISLFWGARNEQDLYFNVEELPCNFAYTPVLSRSPSWRGERGYIQDVFLGQNSNLSNHTVYACGSDAMIQSAKNALIKAGLPSKHFLSDAFVCSNTSVS